MPLPTTRVLRRLPLIIACLAAFAPAALHAQPTVRPGARVRVLTVSADTLMYGTVVGLDSASLLLAPTPDSESLRVPLAGLERLEVSRGRKPSTLLGAAVGAVVGAGTGLGVALLLAEPDDCEFVCGAVQVGSAVIGGTLGLGWGAVIGLQTPRGPERWRPVPIPARPAASRP